MEQYNNTSKEVARQLYESCLDMDYLDYADDIESELAALESEIESIRATHINLSHLLDLFATMNESECPLIESMFEFNKGV